jgi:hypothetical protein
MQRKVYQEIANRFQAMLNCEKSGNVEWLEKHEDAITDICKNVMPSGSGFDSGTQFNDDESKPERLVFETGFHHMNDAGYYDGWTMHKVIVTPSLVYGFTIRVTGRDKRQIKDYIAECFHSALSADIEY